MNVITNGKFVMKDRVVGLISDFYSLEQTDDGTYFHHNNDNHILSDNHKWDK